MREPNPPSNRLTVRPQLEPRKRRPTAEERTEIKEQIGEYISKYGRDFLKAEVNRKAKPRSVGRPQSWDCWRLFTLWLLISAFARRENLKISNVCKKLQGSGGILEDDTGGNPRKVATTSGHIRRLFYTAEQELDKWVPPLHQDPEYIASTDNASLKERLLTYAELLSYHEFFFLTGLRVAQEIVHYELYATVVLLSRHHSPLQQWPASSREMF